MKSDVYETAISIHHKMIVPVLIKTFPKSKLKTVLYDCY